MLIVTGTKRSGTSMWMQILIAAPANWGNTIRDANPSGFYESLLRQGIYWRTNPHPRTGAYFFPEQVERTDPAFNRQDSVDEVGGAVGHAPARARRAEPALLAGVRDDQRLPALSASEVNEAVFGDTTA